MVRARGNAGNPADHEKETAMLTKTDVKAMRTADALCIHLSRNHTAIRAVKRSKAGEPFPHDLEHIIPGKVTIQTAGGRDAIEAGTIKCFAMANLYHSQKHTSSLILHTLRAGDEITFRFWPDAHSNGYLAAAGLHGDAVYLDVRRDGRLVASWDFEQSACPENSARMCQGVPPSEDYQKSAADVLKRA